VVTAGVGGALVGGLMTTGAMLGPRKFQDVIKLLKGWKNAPEAETDPA
jgi:hypothetical protein